MRSTRTRRSNALQAVGAALALAMFAAALVSAATGSSQGPDEHRTVRVVVAPGDTLWTIAAASAAPGDTIAEKVASLRSANRLADARIVPGQVLEVPVADLRSRVAGR